MFDQLIDDRDSRIMSTELAIIPEVLGMDSSGIISKLLVCFNSTSNQLNIEGTALFINHSLTLKSVLTKCSEHNLNVLLQMDGPFFNRSGRRQELTHLLNLKHYKIIYYYNVVRLIHY